jgi:hypothetical protein
MDFNHPDLLRILHGINATRTTGQASWQTKFDNARVTIVEIPREQLPSGALGHYRFIVKKWHGKGKRDWVGVLGKAHVIPTALNRAFEMLLDDRPFVR